jgi:hypothetical protein
MTQSRCVALLAERVEALSQQRTAAAERDVLVRALLTLPRLLWQLEVCASMRVCVV